MPPAVTSGYTHIKGVDAIAGQLPLAITKEFAAPILGTVGPVTAEMIKDNPGVYRVGDVAGLSGLEARYDEQLRGTPGRPGGLRGCRRHAHASSSSSEAGRTASRSG